MILNKFANEMLDWVIAARRKGGRHDLSPPEVEALASIAMTLAVQAADCEPDDPEMEQKLRHRFFSSTSVLDILSPPGLRLKLRSLRKAPHVLADESWRLKLEVCLLNFPEEVEESAQYILLTEFSANSDQEFRDEVILAILASEPTIPATDTFRLDMARGVLLGEIIGVDSAATRRMKNFARRATKDLLGKRD